MWQILTNAYGHILNEFNIVHTLEFWWCIFVLSASSMSNLLGVYYCAVFISFNLGVA